MDFNILKHLIIPALAFCIYCELRSNTLDSFVVVKGDTLEYRVLKNTFDGMVLDDSIVALMRTYTDGKYCLLDSNMAIRFVFKVSGNMLTDTVFTYSKDNKLIGISIFDNGNLKRIIAVNESHCILGLLEKTDPSNNDMEVLLTFSDCRKVRQIIYFEGPIIIKTSENKRIIKKINKQLDFNFTQYFYPKPNEIIFVK